MGWIIGTAPSTTTGAGTPPPHAGRAKQPGPTMEVAQAAPTTTRVVVRAGQCKPSRRHRQVWRKLSGHPSGREMLGHHHLDAGSTRVVVVDTHPLHGSHHYHDVLRLSSRQIHSQVPSQHLEALEILDQAHGKVEIHSYVSTMVVGHGHPVGLHLQSPFPLDVS